MRIWVDGERITEKRAPSASGQATGYGISLPVGRLVLLLSVGALLLLGCHVGLTIYHYQVEELPWLPWRQLFDVDEENNLPTWFSEFILLVATFLLWLCARKQRSEKAPMTDHWYGLTLGFLLLALDEVAGIHETINSLIDMNWAIPGGIVAGVIGLAFIPFVRRLPPRTALLFVVAGVLYVGGAVGMELVGEPMDSDTLQYNLTTVVEEGLEMGGVILLIYALLGHMRGAGVGTLEGSFEIT